MTQTKEERPGPGAPPQSNLAESRLAKIKLPKHLQAKLDMGYPAWIVEMDLRREQQAAAQRIQAKAGNSRRPSGQVGEIKILDRSTMTDEEREIHKAASALGMAHVADAKVLAFRESKVKGEARKSTFRDSFLDLDGLQSLAPAKPLIKGVLDLESATWLIGQPKGFKSFVAIDWACHVASGAESWRGRKVTPGDVLYVAAEGARGMSKRVQAWMQHHEMKPERLRTRPMPVRVRGEAKGSWSVEWQALIDYATEVRPALIVLDTQARMTVGMEENSATEMGVWVDAVDTLKAATGACILVVHHTGRNGGDARGSNSLDGAQDAEWKVDRKPHQLQVTLSCDANKDGDDRQKFVFAMEVVTTGLDEDGEPVTSLVPGGQVAESPTGQEGIAVLDTIAREGESLTNQEWILRTMKVSEPAGDGLTQAEVRRLVNGARGLAEPALKSLNENTYKSTIKRMLSAGQLFKRGQRISLTDPAEDDE